MIELDDWQREVLDYKGDFLLCTGRRVGKTYIMARKAIDKMANNPKTKVVVVSLTEDQSMLIVAMALNYAREKYKAHIGVGRLKPTLKTLTMKNGSKMIARPVGATGDSIRGFEGGVLIVDEAARMPKMFWIAAKPILLTTVGEIWMASTPFGKQGYFWDKFDEGYNKKIPTARFKVFYQTTIKVMSERPISKSWTEEQRKGALRILEEDKREMSHIEYAQEYMGLFMEDLTQFFSDDLIQAVCTGKRKEFDEGEIFMGVDVARMGGDECTYEIFKRKDKDNIYQIENLTRKYQLTTKTEEDIIYYAKMYKVDKIGIDAGSGSLGVGIFDRLMQHDEVKRKIIAMNNRDIVIDRRGEKKQKIFKEEMYDNLKAMMERREIVMLNDENLKASLKSIQEELIEDGIATKRKLTGVYSHIAEGIVRAAWLAKKEKVNKLFIAYM
jgi:hypothetical protein